MKQAALQRKNERAPRLGSRAFPRLMIAPTLLIMLILTAYPLVFTFIYSFTDYQYLKGVENANFVLFENYIDLFQDGYFRQAVLNTIKFTILAVILEMVLGLLIAVFIHNLKRGQKIMRTLLLLPYLLPATCGRMCPLCFCCCTPRSSPCRTASMRRPALTAPALCSSSGM